MSLPTFPATNTKAAPNGHPWRLERMKRPGGFYFILSRGPRDARESISLGYITPTEAEAAHAGIEWLRAHGTAAGAYPTPDRLIAFVRDAPALADKGVSPSEAQTSARGRVLHILTALGNQIADARALRGTFDAAALTALAPELAPDVGDLPVDYPSMPLRQYLATTWEPERSRTNPDTWKKERRLWDGYILPTLGGHRLHDLDPVESPRNAHVHFDELIRTATLKSGEAASGNTKRLIRSAYQACLTFAARHGHIGAVHKFYPIKGSTERRLPEAEPLTPEEIGKLLDAAGASAGRGGDRMSGRMHRCLFAVAVAQGLRPSEALRIDWRHVDLDAGRLYVAGKKTRQSKATIPLFPLAVSELREWWMACGRPSEGPAFTWRGEALGSGSAFKRSLATAAKKAGITKRVTPYVLRHTFATRSLEAGASREEVAAILRHSNPRMVEQHYDHADTARTVDATAFEAWQSAT